MFGNHPKPEHHRGTYHVQSRRVTAAARANPLTRCWRCGLTIDNCKPHRNGKPATWTAGHLNDGEIGGPLAPECSSCNTRAGARLGNKRARQARRRIPNQARRPRHEW